jgi:hypothetical protein
LCATMENTSMKATVSTTIKAFQSMACRASVH